MRKFDFTSSILRFVNGRNNTSSFLREQVEYIIDQVKTDGGTLVATQGCSRKNPLADILTNKRLHQQPHGKQSVHFVLSCASNGVAKSPSDLLKVTQEIVRTVYPDYLAVMAVHTDSKVVHSHVVLDAVNAVTGKKFSQGPGDLNRVKQKTNGILKAHGFEIIRLSANEFIDHSDHSRAAGFDFLELDETELISEQDVHTASLDAEIVGTNASLNTWSDCPLDMPIPYYSSGGFIAMNTMNNELPAAQQPENPAQEATAVALTEHAVSTAAAPSYYPTTTVATGPTLRIKGTPQSDLSGWGS